MTYRKLDHQGIDNAAKNSDKVKSVPGILEVTLKGGGIISSHSTKSLKTNIMHLYPEVKYVMNYLIQVMPTKLAINLNLNLISMAYKIALVIYF